MLRSQDLLTDAGRGVRERLGSARLMLLFTPELCGEREPLDVLADTLDSVDIVQVRVKGLACEHPGPLRTVQGARATWEWCRRVLDLVAGRAGAPLVLVNDRVDVARDLVAKGCAGVHLGHEDAPVDLARAVLGPDALIGLSTHGARDIAGADELEVDYLGFGPVFATSTKGYGRGKGPEAAWVAAEAAAVPLFPIGGIDRETASELASVGRAAVSSAILAAEEPGAAAAALRAMLTEPG